MSIGISTRQKSALERWNAPNRSGFDLTTMWGVDRRIAADRVTVGGTEFHSTGFIHR